MDDWVDPIYQEPSFQQHPGKSSSNNDYHAAPEAAEVIEPAEVLAKIKAFFLKFAAELFQRSRVLDIPVGTVNTQHGPRKSVRALFAKQGQGAAAYTRVVAVLGVVHEMLVKGKTAPQQDIFYRLKDEDSDLFQTPQHLITAIKDVCSLLEVHQEALGIICASRGKVFGQLLVQQHANGSWVDCSVGVQTIPGDCAAIRSFLFQSTARHLVITDSEAIHQRLLEDGFPEQAQAIVVTANGAPDLATRAFLQALISARPHLRPMAVVRSTPSGARYFLIGKSGSSARRGSHQHAVRYLEWLAVRSRMLQREPNELTLQGPLTAQDQALMALEAALEAGALAAKAGAPEDLDAIRELDDKVLLDQETSMGGFSQLLAEDLQRLAAKIAPEWSPYIF